MRPSRRAVRPASASCSAAPTRRPIRCASTSRPRSSTGRSRRPGRRPNLGSGYALSGPAGTAQALKGTRLAYDPERGKLIEWPVYDRYALAPGASVTGPALIEERESTCVIGAGNVATVDAHFNLVAELEADRESQP